MAEYGSRDKNAFNVPKEYKINGVDTKSAVDEQKRRYYLVVDSVTGETTVKSADGKLPSSAGGNSGMDRVVGTIPKDGVFKPTKDFDKPSNSEIKYFTSAQGQKDVKNHAVITAKNAGAQNAQQLIFPNSATPGAGQGQSTAAAGTVESLDTGEAVDGTGKSLKDFGNFTYPLDLGKTKQDVIKFSMLEYIPSGLKFIGKSPVSERTGTGSNIIGTVVLPIPSGISDTNACVWGENTLNAATAAGVAAAFAGITKGIGAGVKEAGDSLTKALADPVTKTGIAALFTANAVGTDGGAILSRTSGVVINPNMELLFNGPTLRPFSFTFKMSARDKKEAEEIIKILNFFKRGMSPIKTKSNLFLKTPHTFKIQYLHRPKGENTDHPYIGRIKECALQSVVVSYAPEGQYATYTDGYMVSYEMQMQFQELEPIFNNDYEGLPGIGY